MPSIRPTLRECLGSAAAPTETTECSRYHDRRDVDDLALRSVSLDVGFAEDLLVRFFAQIEFLGETFERVGALSDARRLPQTSHVHRVAGESLYLDSLVLKLVAVEAVVVEDLRNGRILQILLEVLERSPCLIQVIDPDARATAEVVVRPTVDGGTHDLSVS